jgi:hypothetical protein
MAGHLSAGELLDLAEGIADEQGFPHLASCRECRAQLQDARAALALVNIVEVPEPSPLFWDRLSARIHDAVAAERSSGNAARKRWLRWRLAAPIAAAAVIITVAASVVPRRTRNVPVSPAPPLAIDASAGGLDTPIGDDASLSFVADLASDLDWEGAAQAGFAARADAVDGLLPTLSATETVELQRLLTEAIAQPPARSGV